MTDLHEVTHSMKVSELRHTPVLTVGTTDSLWDAWQLMSLSGLRTLAVLDGTGQCCGIINDRTILIEWPLTEEHLCLRQVGSVMMTPGSVQDSDSVGRAAGQMTRAGVEALPIMDSQGRLSGLLTVGDVAAWLARA